MAQQQRAPRLPSSRDVRRWYAGPALVRRVTLTNVGDGSVEVAAADGRLAHERAQLVGRHVAELVAPRGGLPATPPLRLMYPGVAPFCQDHPLHLQPPM